MRTNRGKIFSYLIRVCRMIIIGFFLKNFLISLGLNLNTFWGFLVFSLTFCGITLPSEQLEANFKSFNKSPDLIRVVHSGLPSPKSINPGENPYFNNYKYGEPSTYQHLVDEESFTKSVDNINAAKGYINDRIKSKNRSISLLDKKDYKTTLIGPNYAGYRKSLKELLDSKDSHKKELVLLDELKADLRRYELSRHSLKDYKARDIPWSTFTELQLKKLAEDNKDPAPEEGLAGSERDKRRWEVEDVFSKRPRNK